MMNRSMKLFLRLWTVVLAVALLTAGSACADQELREDPDNFFANPDPKYAAFVSRAEDFSHSNSFHGVVLIATDDEIILFGGPKGKTREGLPADMHTTYNIGSCTKTFTAVAAFQLIEAGRISLNDPVSRFFPDYKTGEGITIRQMLHMQSGIPDYVNDPEGFWTKVEKGELDAYMTRVFRDDVSDEEFLESLYDAPLYYEPGTQQSYSNTNYYLLGMIIEQVSGVKLCDYFQEHIFDPCGMKNTTSMVVGNETSVPTMFRNLYEEGILDENGYTMQPNSERGAGGVHTCMEDFLAFDRALLSLQLVDSESLEEMMNFEMDYGCGLYPYRGRAFGHSGRDGTYTTQNVIIDSAQFGRVYFLASTPTDAGTYGLDRLMGYVLSLGSGK